MENQLENKRVTNEDIDAMDPRLAALAWENFLKRLDGGMPEKEARDILMEELSEFLKKKASSNPSVLLFDEPILDIAELKKYLANNLDVVKLKFWQTKLSENVQDLEELKKAEAEFTVIFNNLISLLEDVKALSEKINPETPEAARKAHEDLRKAYEAYQIELKNDRQQLDSVSDLKLRTIGYQKFSQRLRKRRLELRNMISKI